MHWKSIMTFDVNKRNKNTTPELLDEIRKVRDELQMDLNFKGKQTTIESYFNRV